MQESERVLSETAKALEVAAQALQEATKSYNAIQKHEAVCEERYKNVQETLELNREHFAEKIDELKEGLDRATEARTQLSNRLWAGVSGVVATLVAAIGYLIQRLLG